MLGNSTSQNGNDVVQQPFWRPTIQKPNWQYETTSATTPLQRPMGLGYKPPTTTGLNYAMDKMVQKQTPTLFKSYLNTNAQQGLTHTFNRP